MIKKQNTEVIAERIMKIAVFEAEKWEQQILAQKLAGHKLIFDKPPLTEKNAKKFSDCDAACVFIYSQINAKVLAQMPKLRLVATMSTGFNHIDVKECLRRKIVVCNVPTYGENTVAEHTFALILALSRKIHESYDRTKMANFSAVGLRGFDLKGKTIGVIGCGHIGQHVVRMARGFGLNILVYERTPNPALAKELGFTYAQIDEIYKSADILTFHVPLTDSTKHMFNSDSLKILKKGCVLINTARGEVVDTKALIKGLQKKIIAAAGLDVLEGECYIREEKQVLSENFAKECDLRAVLQNHVLLRMPNVLITPHNAFNSKEALERILSTTIENVDSFSKGKATNIVSQ